MAERSVAGGAMAPPRPQEAKQPQQSRPINNKAKNGGCGFLCVKYSIFIINLLAWVLGLILTILSALALAQARSGEDVVEGSLSTRPAAGLVLFIGLLLFVLGFLGCCGSVKESTVLLTAYFVILLITAIFLIVAMALAFAFIKSSAFEQTLNDHFKDVITGGRKDKNPREQQEDIDRVYSTQENFRCCGGRGPQDYTESKLNVPTSCYDGGDKKQHLFEKGCSKEIVKYVGRFGLGIGLTCLFTLLALIVAMICSCILIQSIKKGRQLHTTAA